MYFLVASYKSLWPCSNNRSGVSRIYIQRISKEVKVNSWPRVKRCVTLTSGTDRLLHTSYRIIASFPAAPSIPLLDDTPLSLLFHMTARPRRSKARRELTLVPECPLLPREYLRAYVHAMRTTGDNVNKEPRCRPPYGKRLNSPIREQREEKKSKTMRRVSASDRVRVSIVSRARTRARNKEADLKGERKSRRVVSAFGLRTQSRFVLPPISRSRDEDTRALSHLRPHECRRLASWDYISRKLYRERRGHSFFEGWRSNVCQNFGRTRTRANESSRMWLRAIDAKHAEQRELWRDKEREVERERCIGAYIGFMRARALKRRTPTHSANRWRCNWNVRTDVLLLIAPLA